MLITNAANATMVKTHRAMAGSTQAPRMDGGDDLDFGMV